MKKQGFTMVEMIVVIVIIGILSAGTFISLKHLYQRVAKSKALSELSFDSQLIVDQVAALLYDRVPKKVWGYINKDSNKTSIYEIEDNSLKILEWYGTANEYLKAGYYSGFVDMDASDRNTSRLKTFSNAISIDKFQNSAKFALVFAGTFDEGADEYNATINTNDINLSIRPNEIYEKYYIVDSAYSIARGKDINISTCSDNSQKMYENGLYLFYNYHPWRGEKFCQDGNVTILSKESKGFEVGLINDSMYFNITLSRHIKGMDNNITISKQKVVF